MKEKFQSPRKVRSMAEIRKHRPRSSLIGDQVRAGIGDAVPLPIAPGSPEMGTPEADTHDADDGLSGGADGVGAAAGAGGISGSASGHVRIDFTSESEATVVDPFFVESPTAPEPVSPDASAEQAGKYTLRAADRGGLIALGSDAISAMSVVFRDKSRADDDDPDELDE